MRYIILEYHTDSDPGLNYTDADPVFNDTDPDLNDCNHVHCTDPVPCRSNVNNHFQLI